MPRSLGRYVHIYDQNNPGAELGGPILTNDNQFLLLFDG